jgi:transposase
MEIGMRNDTTVFVGLDVHKESIVAAYAIGAGEILDLGNIGVLQRDLDRLCARMRTKGSRVRFVYHRRICWLRR